MTTLAEAIKIGNNGWALLFKSWPIYVTREYDDFQVQYLIPGIVALAILFLLWINAIGWGIYGVIELINKVI
jgi:hypothetical protein